MPPSYVPSIKFSLSKTVEKIQNRLLDFEIYHITADLVVEKLILKKGLESALTLSGPSFQINVRSRQGGGGILPPLGFVLF